MKISILHTSARPNQWRATYDAWIAAAAHPENVEYILCIDYRWGTLASWGVEEFYGGRRGRNKVVLNKHPYKHSGATAGHNECAKDSSGDVLVVIADDLFPCPNWDQLIVETAVAGMRAEPLSPDGMLKDWLIWCPTGTPTEFERNIIIAPIMSRSLYQRWGYVFYPKFESMYSDNDMTEHAQLDQLEGRCVIIRGGFAFDHRHPFFKPESMDDAYRAQNDPELYDQGLRLLKARREAKFQDVVEVKQEKRRFVVCIPGEMFPRRWVEEWTHLIGSWGWTHDLDVLSGYSTQVYLMRAGNAKDILERGQKPDYILWIDDDNPPIAAGAQQLLRDLEANPEIGMVAGWTLTQTGQTSFGPIVDGRRLDADLEKFLSEGPDLQRVAWTGFPMLLMRYALLADVGYRAFLPRQEGTESDWEGHVGYGFIGEDLGFCAAAAEKGWQIYVDRRVKVEHLKLQDCAALPPVKPEREGAAPSAGPGRPFIEFLQNLPFGVTVPKETHCENSDCCLEAGHPGSCYLKSEHPAPPALVVPGFVDSLGTANAEPAAQEPAPEAKQ